MYNRFRSVQSLFPINAKPNLEPRNIHGWLNDENKKHIKRLVGQMYYNATFLELGVWEGLTADFVLSQNPKINYIGIDTFLGSAEHKEHGEWKQHLPNLYKYRHRVALIPKTTIDGLALLRQFGVQPQIIYIDASHRYEDVLLDILLSCRVNSGAAICGDDFEWDSVQKAVHAAQMFMNHNLMAEGNFWMFIEKNKTPQFD